MKIRKLAAFVLAILMLASMAVSSSLASGTPEKVTMTCFFVSDTNDPDPLTNAETLELEALTGVHLDFTVVPTDGAKEKLNLMLASDSYPDIIMTGAGDRNFTNAELVKYGTDEKILIPLNDLIDKYAIKAIILNSLYISQSGIAGFLE
jgi:putative aldouronate transport system substrate-binding protein